MSISHRTNRLKLISAPSVEKLQNDRFRLVFNATPLNPREDWYNANKSRIFADYGSLQSAEMSVDGISARTGAAYSDMRLTDVQTSGGTDSYTVQFTYETLGSSFVQVKDDTIDFELNGLRRVTRTSIAQAGTDFQKTVGTTTITSQIDTETAVTCFLASYEIDDTDSYRQVTEVYIQAGELSRDIRSVGRGVQQTTHQFLVTEGTTTGDVISRETDDFEGLKRITVSVIAKPDGTTLTNSDGSAKLNYTQQQIVPFTFPGVVDLQNRDNHIFPTVRSPVEAKVVATVDTYYQSDTSNIVSADFTTRSALELWNPTEWCQKISTISATFDKPAYFNAQGLRGCRTRSAFILEGALEDLSLSGGGSFEYSSVGRTQKVNRLFLEETTDLNEGKSVFRYVFEYTHDSTYRVSNLGGVGVFRPPLEAKGTFTFEVKWNGEQWVLTGTNQISDPQPSNPSTSTDTAVFSAAAGGYSITYNNKTGSTSFSFTASGGGDNPNEATWGTGITANPIAKEESYAVSSRFASTVGSNTIAETFSFIEGRIVSEGAYGTIKISGGPDNPLGKVYTLDVNLEKVFTKIDGTDVYRKTITTAECTPA
tara:strand:+ start:1916 stop:3700 length:1785 start_codon:yes stop_codon:yes gene_type:complete